MGPIEKFEANCTVMLVSSSTLEKQQQKQQQEQRQTEQQQQQHQQQQQYDITSLSAFSDIYNEYLDQSDQSEIETASTSTSTSSSSDCDSSASISTSIPTSIALKENYENIRKNQPDIRHNLHNNQLFSVQLEVNFLLLEAERRKLKVLQQELNLSLDECDTFERKKRGQSQCHELLLAIS